MAGVIESPEEMIDVIAYNKTTDRKGQVSEYFALEPEVSLTSRSMHYSNTFFEGSVVVVHPGKDGSHRLYLLHQDWHHARLMNGLEYCLRPHVPISRDQYLLSIVNLLYANGWDANKPVNLTGNEVNEIYVRPLAYRGASDILPLSGADSYSLAVFAFPKPSYHGKAGDGFSVLAVPEPRTLSAPHMKRSDNYPQADLWIERMRKMLAWIERDKPEIIIDGEKVPAGEKYKQAVEMLKGSLKEVLFCNSEGKVTEGSAENVAMVNWNLLYTPPLKDGVLPGFTMQKTELMGEMLGLRVFREGFTLKKAKKADLLILTGTAANAVKVDRIVECGWDNDIDGNRNYSPKGQVTVTSIGNMRGAQIYEKISEEHLKIKAGKSSLGKFGFYADDCLAPKEIRELREMAEFIRRNGKLDRTVFRGLRGDVPPGSETKLAGGKQLTYGKLLNIR